MRCKFYLFYLIFSIPVYLFAQQKDTVINHTISKDSLQISNTSFQYCPISFDNVLSKNIFINSQSYPIANNVVVKKNNHTDWVFYLLLSLMFLLALLKYFYAQYFSNLFKVFFNASFRQNQLTDQLLQAKLPSLLFNIFFVISGGCFAYFLFWHNKSINNYHSLIELLLCILCLSIIYFIKFITLKFTGWVTEHKEITDSYLFIIFLIAKIIGILLVPCIILITYSEIQIGNTIILITIIFIALLFLLRFIKTYGLLQNQLHISRAHFFLYLIGAELLPLLLIYKYLMILLNKSM